MVAFTSLPDSGVGRQTLWVRPLDSAVARQLPETNGASLPFWSPDSKSIAFGVEGKVKRVEVSGGPPMALADLESLSAVGALRASSCSHSSAAS
jgi:hypothetical protein